MSDRNDLYTFHHSAILGHASLLEHCDDSVFAQSIRSTHAYFALPYNRYCQVVHYYHYAIFRKFSQRFTELCGVDGNYLALVYSTPAMC